MTQIFSPQMTQIFSPQMTQMFADAFNYSQIIFLVIYLWNIRFLRLWTSSVFFFRPNGAME
ncbi:MAG: hypothetical protein LBC20_07505 [Planctomycetaceae bacterium]|nr:hypothetical protein [Planctomycetaceae bacterium]